MKDKGKTKAQFIKEMAEMRLCIAEMEKSETERAGAEIALRESEELYRTLIETSPDSIIMYSLSGKILAASSQVATVYGVSSVAEFLQEVKTVFDLLTEEGKAFAAANLRRTLSEGHSQKNEYLVRNRNGRLIPMEINSSVVRSATGEPRSFISVIRDISERKSAEEELRVSAEKYRILFESFPLGISITDDKGNILESNAEVDRLFRRLGRQKKRKTIFDPDLRVIRPDGSDKPLEEYPSGLALRENRLVAGVEVGMDIGEDEIVWVTVTAAPIPIEGYGVVITYKDVTERKQAEEALRKSEEKYRSILENIEEGYHEVNLNGDFTFFNDSFQRIMGYSREELMGINYKRFAADEENARKIFQAYNRVYRTGEPLTRFEWDIIRKDGVRRSVEVSASLIKDSSGNPQGFRGIVTDITDRKRAEEALTKSEERFRKVFYTSPDSVNITRLEDGMFISSNLAFTKIMGYTEEDITGKTSIEHNIWENIEDRQRLVAGLKKDGKVTNLEAAFRTKGGDIIYGLMSASVIDLNGVPHSLSITRDITDRKRAEDQRREMEERLQRAEKMEVIGLLAGGVAHDLNNVLGVVIGYSELLLMDADKSRSIRPSLVKIMNGGQKAAAIVQDLLTLARRGVSGRDVLNLNKIIADCQQSPEFERLSSYHSDVRIKTDLDPGLLNISGSSVHLGKTLFNLVSNASEAMPKGGVVTIKTANQYLDKPIQGYDEVREGDHVVLSVSDTGEGIPAADLKRIFEPFYTKKVMGRSGTGLGLAVVWGTVKDHNGYINVQSEEGKGSIVTLYFPVTREDISAEAAAISISEYMGNGESILIVDDVTEQCDLAAGMLRKLNYNVASVSSGEEAIAYLKEHKIELIVLDMIMDPGMDGLDTYKKVLEIHPQQKAIIVSGFSESDRVHAAQALGAGVYVRKPYVIEKLGLAVRTELDRK